MNASVISSLRIASHHPKSDSIQGSGLMYQGIFSCDSLSTGLPADFLAGEFLLRLPDEERLAVLAETFVLAGMHGNDGAAAVFLNNFQIFLRHNEHSFDRSGVLGKEKYKKEYEESRAVGERLFGVIQDAYWKLPLYSWDPGKGDFLVQVNQMRKTKKLVFTLMAELWSCVGDNLGERAFWFLCDACSAETVIQRSALFAAETARRKKDFPQLETVPRFYFQMPKEDVDAVLHAMRTVIPNGDRGEDKVTIKAWLREITSCQPDPVRRLLGHAYVNAGGLID